MVKICEDKYPESNTDYIEYYKEFPYELDHFQKWSIEAIEKQCNLLVTAHTGSGKSMPFEYAVKKYCLRNKNNLDLEDSSYTQKRNKVIYTSPIKSLSNQKYHELKNKYPELQVGILTGDIKFNPEADVLIMTTEILKNTLFVKEEIKNISEKINHGEKRENECLQEKENQIKHLENLKQTLHFDIDINNELAAVVFDEVHYINDEGRGKVWEETIMMLPKHIQLIMLSATIDKAHKFAFWVETIKNVEVYLASTNIRVVPLTHYSYECYPDTILKSINAKDKVMYSEVRKLNSSLEVLRENNGKYHNDTVNKLSKIRKFMYKERIYRPKVEYVLNNVASYMKANDMLPAICFTFSRNKVESYAKSIEQNLYSEDESIKSSLVEKECKNILMKLPNYKEYLELPEYRIIVELLKKGVAIHHSGVIPILREMIELMFEKGYIKLLFATETFAVGINMPTKTALFTSLKKYDGSCERYLYSHEYTQMAGRAGRRGLDKVGHVIHLTSIFKDLPYNSEYMNILSGVPQTLKSKFEIDAGLLLKVMNNLDGSEVYAIKNYIEKSMSNREKQEIMETDKIELEKQMKDLENREQSLKLLKTSIEIMDEYIEMKSQLQYKKGKQLKLLTRKLENIESSSKTFKKDIEFYIDYKKVDGEKREKKRQLEELNNLYTEKIELILMFLENGKYIEYVEQHIEDNVNKGNHEITIKGKIASMMMEMNGLVMSELLMSKEFNNLDTDEIIALLTLYSGIRLKEEYKITTYKECENLNISSNLYDILKKHNEINEKTLSDELHYLGNINKDDYEVSYDLVEIIYSWVKSTNEEECKLCIEELYKWEIFVGEFIKIILKINNIVLELEKVALVLENIELYSKLSTIRMKTLKYIATNDSLYLHV